MTAPRLQPALSEDPETWARAIRWFARTNAGLINHFPADADDLEQELWIAMLHESTKEGFADVLQDSSLFFAVMRRRMIDWLRVATHSRNLGVEGWQRQKRFNNYIELVPPWHHGEMRPAWGREVNTEPDEWMDLIATVEFFDLLEPKDLQMVRWRFQGWSLRQIGDEVGLSESRICQRFGRLHQKYLTWRDAQ